MTNTRRYTFPLLAACAILPTYGLFAQAPATTVAPAATTTTTTATAPEARPAHEGMKERMEALTPEEREKYKAAHKAALQDPAVKAAEATKATDHKGYSKALREAMLKADPSIQSILDKLHAEHQKH